MHFFSTRQWHPTPALLPGKSHGQRSLVGCSPWGRWESDATGRLHFHFSLSCIGEGNGNPLQCSCLESPGDGGAWWAAVYEVTQSPTWLNRLSSSNRHFKNFLCFSLVLSSFPIIYLGLVFFLLGVCRSSSVYCLLPFFIWKILFKSTFLSFSVFLELFLHVFDL